jgi:hypothetical protein
MCASYSKCLGVAAKRNTWLDCSDCPRKSEKSLISDFLGETVLLLRLFLPDLYQQFPSNHGTRIILDAAHDSRKRQLPY